MGTWISHFRIAERLLATLPGVDPQAFLIGNVAPDSGRPNADWTVFDPPKTVTHFLNPGEDEGRIRDLEFYRDWVRPVLAAGSPDASFLLGYFTHLVSDNLWMHLIGDPTKGAFAADFAADRAGTWERVKDDWYDLDHKFLRDVPDNAYARLVVGAANPPSPLPFLPAGALADRLDDLRAFYGAPPAHPLDRPYPHLAETTMTRAVHDSAQWIAALLQRLRTDTLDPHTISTRALPVPSPYSLP